MATLKINLPNQEVKEISEIDLATQTPASLIDELINQESVASLPGEEEYRMTKGSMVISKDEHNKSLKELGLQDCDEISLISKPTGA